MKENYDNNIDPILNKKEHEKKYPSETLTYPVEEDIYSKCKEDENIDPEDISMDKSVNITDEGNAETQTDLDIPGTELDDQQENIGSEDEENNYYSLGGDGHNDLDEDITR
jgi:hypothetical protein